MTDTQRGVAVATTILQQVCTFVLILSTLAMIVLTGAAFAGLVPWIDLPVALSGAEVVQAGMWAQVGLTALLLILAGFLPSNARVRRLELTNRDFQISMADVALAYDHVHRADREGVFKLSREFDAMRDRIAWMRDHPDLQGLEHDVLTAAAQMSVESHDLAEVYSAEKVSRARSFLRQRQREIEDYRQRISMAQATAGEIKRWMQALSVEEGLAEKQLDRLRRDLAEITDAMALTGHDKPGNVVGLGGGKRAGGAGAEAVPAE